MDNENEIEYLVEENEFKHSKKRRKPFLLILAIAALVLALANWFQIVMKLIDPSFSFSNKNILNIAIVSSIGFGFFFLLFLIIRTSGSKDIITKRDEPSNDNPTRNVEVVDSFVELVEDDAYLVADDEEEAANKKEEVEDVDTFNLTTKIISDRLTASFHNNSLHCDTAYLTGALASSNFIFISKNDQQEDLVLSSISNGISGRSLLIDGSRITSSFDLTSYHELLSFIDEATNDMNKLYFVGLTNIPLDLIKDVLSDFLEALYDKNNSSRVDLTVNGSVETHFISQNLYFVVFNNDDEKFFQLPASILKYSIGINLGIKNIEFEHVELDNLDISYYDFRRVINNSLTTNYMSEDRWNKIDALATFLNTKKPYAIANDVLNNIEAFSSVLLSLGTRKDITFDRVCSDILLPPILKDFGREYIIGDDGIYHYVNDNFSNSYSMPKTEMLIKDARYLDKDVNDASGHEIIDSFDSVLDDSSKKKNSK